MYFLLLRCRGNDQSQTAGEIDPSRDLSNNVVIITDNSDLPNSFDLRGSEQTYIDDYGDGDGVTVVDEDVHLAVDNINSNGDEETVINENDEIHQSNQLTTSKHNEREGIQRLVPTPVSSNPPEQESTSEGLGQLFFGGTTKASPLYINENSNERKPVIFNGKSNHLVISRTDNTQNKLTTSTNGLFHTSSSSTVSKSSNRNVKAYSSIGQQLFGGEQVLHLNNMSPTPANILKQNLPSVGQQIFGGHPDATSVNLPNDLSDINTSEETAIADLDILSPIIVVEPEEPDGSITQSSSSLVKKHGISKQERLGIATKQLPTELGSSDLELQFTVSSNIKKTPINLGSDISSGIYPVTVELNTQAPPRTTTPVSNTVHIISDNTKAPAIKDVTTQFLVTTSTTKKTKTTSEPRMPPSTKIPKRPPTISKFTGPSSPSPPPATHVDLQTSKKFITLDRLPSTLPSESNGPSTVLSGGTPHQGTFSSTSSTITPNKFTSVSNNILEKPSFRDAGRESFTGSLFYSSRNNRRSKIIAPSLSHITKQTIIPRRKYTPNLKTLPQTKGTTKIPTTSSQVGSSSSQGSPSEPQENIKQHVTSDETNSAKHSTPSVKQPFLPKDEDDKKTNSISVEEPPNTETEIFTTTPLTVRHLPIVTDTKRTNELTGEDDNNVRHETFTSPPVTTQRVTTNVIYDNTKSSNDYSTHTDSDSNVPSGTNIELIHVTNTNGAGFTHPKNRGINELDSNSHVHSTSFKTTNGRTFNTETDPNNIITTINRLLNYKSSTDNDQINGLFTSLPANALPHITGTVENVQHLKTLNEVLYNLKKDNALSGSDVDAEVNTIYEPTVTVNPKATSIKISTPQLPTVRPAISAATAAIDNEDTSSTSHFHESSETHVERIAPVQTTGVTQIHYIKSILKIILYIQ